MASIPQNLLWTRGALASDALGSRSTRFIECPKTDTTYEGPALPQRLPGGRPVPPECWGVTRWQCLELLLRLRGMVKRGEWDPKASVYELVEQILKPETRGKGYGMALLWNLKEPLEVNTMVSHAWGEGAIEFLEAICRSTSDKDVLFICAFSLYQCGDECGPSIAEQLGSLAEDSPFRRVLNHISAQGTASPGRAFWYKYGSRYEQAVLFVGIAAIAVLYTPTVLDGVVFTFAGSCVKERVEFPPPAHWAWTWRELWPAFQVCLPAAIALGSLCLLMTAIAAFWPDMYRGRMIVVPNRAHDIYDRLWCVYEIFIAKELSIPCELARTMARCGLASSESAQCTNQNDFARIREEIEELHPQGDGFEEIDTQIRRVSRADKWAVFLLVFCWLVPVCIVGLAFFNMHDPRDCREEFWGVEAGICVSLIGLVVAWYWAFKRHQGMLPALIMLAMLLVQLWLALLFEGLYVISHREMAVCDGTFSYHRPSKRAWSFANGYSRSSRLVFGAMSLYTLLALAHTFLTRKPPRFEKTCRGKLGFVALFAVWVAVRPRAMPLAAWQDAAQAFPEAFQILTGYLANFALPLNMIWGASLFWGLHVDPDSWRRCPSRADGSADSIRDVEMPEGSSPDAAEAPFLP